MNCPRCGFNLTGLRTSSCPNCGLTLQAPGQGFGGRGAPPPARPGQQGGQLGEDATPPPYGGWAPPPGDPGRPLEGQPPYGPPPAGGTYGPPPSGQPLYGSPRGGSGGPGYPQPGGPVPPPRPAKKGAGHARTLISSVAGLVVVVAVVVALNVAKINLFNTSAPDSYSLTAVAAGWNNDQNCTFKSDGYHISGAYICYAPSDQLGDGVVQVQVKQVSGPTDAIYGLVFRRVSKGNYYTLVISSAGDWLAGVVTSNGTPKPLAGGASTAIATGLGTSNTLKVAMSGTSFQFYINNMLVGSATDTTFSKGDTGLSGDNNADIVYTNFKITR